MIKNADLKRRILEISFIHSTSHIGSCMTAVDIIDSIYKSKWKEDLFVLSSGHAGLALYVVLEKYEHLNAEALFLKHGVHPNRDLDDKIYVSSGSLGHGIGIACGLAYANQNRRIYCLLSDGEMAEGSVYESLNLAKSLKLCNLHLHINCNGYGAYRKIYPYTISSLVYNYPGLDVTLHSTKDELPFLNGLDAHYYKLTEKDYKLGLQWLS